jgi:CRISPR-associated protein (TIGR03984 family)
MSGIRAAEPLVAGRASTWAPIAVPTTGDASAALDGWLGLSVSSDDTTAAWRRWLDGKPAWMIVQLDEAIGFGVVDGSGIILDPALRTPLTLGRLLDARVFNEHGEIHLWRGPDGQPRARGRRDEDGREEASTFDEGWLLWGTRVDEANEGSGWTTVTEDRGTTVRVPVAITNADRQLPLRLVVRQYLDEDDLGMPSFGDVRFVGLTTADRFDDDHPTRKLLDPGIPSGGTS